jgi:hypothetical protein
MLWPAHSCRVSIQQKVQEDVRLAPSKPKASESTAASDPAQAFFVENLPSGRPAQRLCKLPPAAVLGVVLVYASVAHAVEGVKTQRAVMRAVDDLKRGVTCG